ncbi:MAG: hypothetical protein JW760_00685, partial [Spirochaetales bacterium]|nr:hypothetical protein [Spirochaetales bacterium]
HAGTSVILILLFSLIGGGSVARDTDQAGVYLQGITLLALAFLSLALIVFHLTRSKRHRFREPSIPASGRGVYGLLVVSSLIPCPGATMLLLFALSLQLPLFGILGVLSMSLGMGVVISLAGYLAYAGREGLFQRLKDRRELLRKLSDGLEIASYLFIFLFSLHMARPFIADLFG